MTIFASFARYIFLTFTFKATIIILCYVAPYIVCSSSLTPKRMTMTLSGHFALKSGSSSASNGLFGNLQSYAYTVSGNKNIARRLYW